MDLVRRPILCALGLSIVLLAAAPAAFAQASGAAVFSPPATGTVAQAEPSFPPSPSPAPAPAKPKPRKRRTYVDLTITPIKSFGIGADQLAPPGTLTDNQIGINGLLSIHVLPHLRLYERRDNHLDLGGRQYRGGKPSYGGLSHDLEYDTGLAYELTRDLEIGEEFMYRYRVCCPNAGDPNNPTPRIEQGLRTAVTYFAGPRTRIGRPLRLRVEGNYVNHHADLGLKLPGGTSVLGKTWVSKLSAYLSVPVLGQKKFYPYFGIEHYADFYDNQLVPSNTNRSFYGIVLPGTSLVSYRFYVKSEHQTNPAGDVPHKVELYLEASFKFHY